MLPRRISTINWLHSENPPKFLIFTWIQIDQRAAVWSSIKLIFAVTNFLHPLSGFVPTPSTRAHTKHVLVFDNVVELYLLTTIFCKKGKFIHSLIHSGHSFILSASQSVSFLNISPFLILWHPVAFIIQFLYDKITVMHWLLTKSSLDCSIPGSFCSFLYSWAYSDYIKQDTIQDAIWQ